MWSCRFAITTRTRLRLDTSAAPRFQCAYQFEAEPKYTLKVPVRKFGWISFALAFWLDRMDVSSPITSREPWWENQELLSRKKDNLEPMAWRERYFPNDPKAYRLEIAKVSTQADLAILQVYSR